MHEYKQFTKELTNDSYEELKQKLLREHKT